MVAHKHSSIERKVVNMPVRVGLQYIEKWNSSMEDAVRKYEQEPLEKGQIVFYGASNFTRWGRGTRWDHKPLREVMLGKSGKPCAVNRGFGSSNAEHQLYYYPRMVRPLEPKVLVYHPFGNYRSSAVNTDTERQTFIQFVCYVYIIPPKKCLVNNHKQSFLTCKDATYS